LLELRVADLVQGALEGARLQTGSSPGGPWVSQRRGLSF